MKVRIRHPLRTSLAACAGLAALVLAAGCSAAPPGATEDSAAIGPVRPAGSTNFAPFPVPTRWNGYEAVVYVMVVKAKTGTTPRDFGFTDKQNMVFWLNCIGKGKVQLASPAIGLKWDIPCGNGDNPAGINFRSPSSAVGHRAIARVTVTRGSRWEVRIDAPVPSK